MNSQILTVDSQKKTLFCHGEWHLANWELINNELAKILASAPNELFIDGSDIKKLDSAGAWQLCHFKYQLERKKVSVAWQHFSKEQNALFDLIEHQKEARDQIKAKPRLSWLQRVGRISLIQAQYFNNYLIFAGQLTQEFLRILRAPSHFRIPAISNVIYQSGYQALFIIALLSLMIGVVITYQMGLQLRNYGANIYIVDLLGLSILREFGPLLTAIMVAGRTGSAFTAQLGMMKINQEVDALDTMGVTPAEILLLPKIIGLLIALPLLTIWANMFGVLGGMIMANNMLNITWYDFLHRFPTVIPLRALLIGLGKTPVFALLIASIACFQGMRVTGSATSVGRNTTRSVVLAIFFIIVADAIFSVIFSKLKL